MDRVKEWLKTNGYAQVSDAITAAAGDLSEIVSKLASAPCVYAPVPLVEQAEQTTYLRAEFRREHAVRDGVSGYEVIGTIPTTNVEVVVAFTPSN